MALSYILVKAYVYKSNSNTEKFVVNVKALKLTYR